VDDLENPREPAPRLVFFDLDGTITRRDTLIGYVAGFALRHPLRLFGFLAALPALLRFLVVDRDRGRLKGELLHAVMGGARREQVEAWTTAFVRRLIARGCFREALNCIAHHRTVGDHLVLMSATVDLYVPEIAANLGFHEHVCSHVAWQDDRLEGRLIGANVRDEEKARQVRALAARFPGRRLVGYGNSHPDLNHLRLVDQAVLVNAGNRLRRAAAALPVDFKIWL